MKHIRNRKASSYFSRFQVQYRRRRDGKTDYRARLRLISQDKNKYNTLKYRLVVRFSNKDIVCQVIFATVYGDNVVCSAYARELKRYGLEVGHSNYAAAYCVGLLCGYRCLAKSGLSTVSKSGAEVTKIDSPSSTSSCDAKTTSTTDSTKKHRRPFTLVLDVGLKRTSKGSKVFAALKGALDSGLNIPHNEKCFVGYDIAREREKKARRYEPEITKKHILGGRVSEIMAALREEPERFRRQFSQYIKHKIKPHELKELYEKVHEAIRADPTASAPRPRNITRASTLDFHTAKLSLAQRKENLKKRLLALGSK